MILSCCYIVVVSGDDRVARIRHANNTTKVSRKSESCEENVGIDSENRKPGSFAALGFSLLPTSVSWGKVQKTLSPPR